MTPEEEARERAELAALREAYFSGVRVVEYADRKVEYRSLLEIKRLFDEKQQALVPARIVRQVRVATRRGF
ncbi:phage head-tail joining protein [Elstera sp.]|jgi:hypothetical protein|uniref:phage head-tail joining protein n=1 Tax=Elstera sp. TaxID=1916664 RepID=UPI0037BFDDB3